MMKSSAIYPGTFDPITLGHVDVIQRAARIFDRVVVAVAKSTKKTTLFSLQERMDFIRAALEGEKSVEIDSFDGLLVDYAHKKDMGVLIRGLRAFSDFEYEFQMALTNRKMSPDVETMFLMPKDEFSYLSSSMVREVAELGGDVSGFVPPMVQKAFAAKLRS